MVVIFNSKGIINIFIVLLVLSRDTSAAKMSRRRADSQGSLGPDDEVMPYSDDETDDELDATSEEESDDVPRAPEPPVEAKPSGDSLNAD